MLRKLTFLFFLVLIVLSFTSVVVAEDITLEELISNMERAENNINDFSCDVTYKDRVSKELTIFIKKPYKMRIDYRLEGSTYILKKEGENLYSYLWIPSSNQLLKIKVHPQGWPVWPSTHNILEMIKNLKSKSIPHTAKKEKVNGDDVYILTFEFPDQQRKVLYYIKQSNWLPYKRMTYRNNKIFAYLELHNININTGLSDDLFELKIPEDATVVTPEFPEIKEKELVKLMNSLPGLEDLKKWLLELEFPVYPGAYDIKREPGVSATIGGEDKPINYKKISYKVKIRQPSKEVFELYDEFFKKHNWQDSYKGKDDATREWMNYKKMGDETLYSAFKADWIDPTKNYIVHLKLTHAKPVGEEGFSDDQEVFCIVIPSWTYPEPEDFPISKITIKNMTGEDITDVSLNYNNKQQVFGNIVKGESKTVLNESGSDISFDLRYFTSINGIPSGYSFKNMFHIQARGSHITINLKPDGELEEEMQFFPPDKVPDVTDYLR